MIEYTLDIISDVDDVLVCIEEFIEESNYRLTYNRLNSIRYINNIMYDDSTTILTIYNNDTIVGFAIIGYSSSFYTERRGSIQKFYIRKQYRGTRAARKLIKGINGWFDLCDVVDTTVSGIANIGENKMFTNLLIKHDYNITGDTLTRLGGV